MTVAQQILQAVLYADLFEHPMTEREVWRWMPTSVPISKRAFAIALAKLVRQKKVMAITPFVLFPKHKQYLGLHASRLMVSQKKWKKAYGIARMLRYIPTILFVGVTGSLAMNNAKDNDDIDICIITAPKTVWITRLVSTVLVELFARRRHPYTTNIKDTICLNMFLSEHSLRMDALHQDVYIAHELLQMVPLWERKGITRKLLQVNKWVRTYYRHAYDEKMKQIVRHTPRHKRAEKIWKIIERPVKWAQICYMRSKRTTEEISANQILFHPANTRESVIATYQLRCKSYKIPLDNNEK